MDNEIKLTSNIDMLAKSKRLIFIVMLYVVITTVSGVTLYRFVSLGPFLFPGGVFIFPCIYILSDILAEVYGYKIARLVIWYSLMCNFIFAFYIIFIIHLPAPLHQPYTREYYHIFHSLLRLDAANLIGVLAGRFANIYFLSKWKVLLRGKYFILRSFGANIIGESIMLVIAAMITLVGRYSFGEILHLILSDYFVRIVFALLLAVPASYIVKYLKSKELVDVYDYCTNFNPFRISVTDDSEQSSLRGE